MTDTPDSYIVQPNDTLSEIAEMFQLSLQELLELNPKFKPRVHYIYPGEEVKLSAGQPQPSQQPPPQPHSKAEPRLNSEAEQASNNGTEQPLVMLPPADKPLNAGPYPVIVAPIITCPKANRCQEYDDILFLVNDNVFYLLDPDASDFIRQAEAKLAGHFEQDGKRIAQGLAESGLTGGMFEANLEFFIPDERKEEYRKAKSWHDKASFHSGRRTVNELEKDAIEALKKQGYSYENDKLYPARENKIEKAIKAYQSERKKFAEKKHQSPQQQISELEVLLAHYSAIWSEEYKNSYDDLEITPETEQKYSQYLSKLNTAEKGIKPLMKAIADLARLGYATPEYALAGNGSKESGHTLLAEYYGYLKKVSEWQEVMHKRLKLISDNSGLSIPPAQLFKKESDLIEKYRQQADKIHQQALQNMAAARKSLYLIWDIDSYKYNKKPLQRLVKDDFPLREFVAAGFASQGTASVRLRHFSLNDIPHTTGTTPPQYSASGGPGMLFERLLKPYIRRLDIHPQWFDKEGFFKPQSLYKELEEQNIVVKSLQGGDNSAWEKTIKQVLYSGKLKEHLDPFDSAYQAQYFRLVTGTQAGVDKVSLTFNNSSDPNAPSRELAGLNLEAKAELDLARGELNLIEALTGKPYICFPEKVDPALRFSVTEEALLPSKAEEAQKQDKPSKAPDNQAKLTEFGFGALQLRLYCKAYGFAAAGFALGGGVKWTSNGLECTTPFGINPNETDEDGNLTTSLNRDQIQFDIIGLKAGATVGVELGSFIDWHLPLDSNGRLTLPEFVLPKDKKGKKVLTLARASVKLELQKELKVPIRFSRRDQKLLAEVRVQKGNLAFVLEGEVEPDTLSAWIWQFQRLLRQCHYRRIQIVDSDETFQALSEMSQLMVCSQLQIGLLMANTKNWYDGIADIFRKSSSAAIAYSLVMVADRKAFLRWIETIHPEALGPLLSVLLEEPEAQEIEVYEKVPAKAQNTQNAAGKATQNTEQEEWQLVKVYLVQAQVLAMQQVVIGNILLRLLKVLKTESPGESGSGAPSRRLMEEALARVNKSGKAHPIREGRLLDLKDNRDRIWELLRPRPRIDEDKRTDKRIQRINWQLREDLLKIRTYRLTENGFRKSELRDALNALTFPLYDEVSENYAQYQQDLQQAEKEARHQQAMEQLSSGARVL